MKTDEQARHDALRAPSDRVRLVVSDVDGTLLDPDKDIAASTRQAIRTLAEAGVPVCLVSSRPPAGMSSFLEVTGKDLPFGSLNGAVISDGRGKVLSSLTLPEDVVRMAVDMLAVHGVDQWFYTDSEWLVHDETSAYVPKESRGTGIRPKVISSVDPWIDRIGKITGSGSDYPLLERIETEIGALLSGQAHVARSSPYYLDITPEGASKGHALKELARLFGITPDQVACLGDMPNDVPMMDVAGVAIAMGQASGEVASHAHFRTAPNDQDGWARAVTDYILPRVKADG
ncbi:HAD family hydrolase [Acetobacter sp. AN02]|uniref:HAD family hydrolase n=1 Tax=Acetobacter sp. AN02 TaxID=2894186 RepID=UPI0024342AB0|nr:HAD family hydrolase [Acetobacter sp. AN02]MDG6093623.1 HAD family hydrolase [Acetobacter sp. AN02]